MFGPLPDRLKICQSQLSSELAWAKYCSSVHSAEEFKVIYEMYPVNEAQNQKHRVKVPLTATSALGPVNPEMYCLLLS